MEQQEQPRWRPTRRQFLWGVGIVVALAMLTSVLGGYVFGWEWTGIVKDDNYHKRTLWDWLQLLIIPAVLAGGGLWFNQQQQERQREDDRRQQERGLEIEKQRAQDEALQTYLDQIGQLLLDKDSPLRKSTKDDEVRTLSRARTLTVLPRLDDARKGTVVQFLYEADLITTKTTRYIPGKDTIDTPKESNIEDIQRWIQRWVIKPNTGDIQRWITRGRIVDLRGADLSRSSLGGTILDRAHLAGADLSGADLSGAHLTTYREGFLRVADLSDTNLSGANLSNVTLASSASLPKFAQNGMEEIPIGGEPTMEMKQEIQQRVDCIAELTVEEKACRELEYLAKSLKGATMPNGQRYEEWIKSRGEGDSGS
jgi:Pentapeptide repeats (8 copies)